MLLRRASTTARPSTPIANQINRATGDGVELLLEPTVKVDVGGGVPAATLLTTEAEQMTRPPPPSPEPLHWFIATAWADAIVPVAWQVSWTSVPPLAEPLHWVIAAPLVVAGKGVQPVWRPSPDPTHWFTVAAVAPGARPP